MECKKCELVDRLLWPLNPQAWSLTCLQRSSNGSCVKLPKPSWRGLRRRVQALTCLWPVSDSAWVRVLQFLTVVRTLPAPEEPTEEMKCLLLFDCKKPTETCSSLAPECLRKVWKLPDLPVIARVWSSGLSSRKLASRPRNAEKHGGMGPGLTLQTAVLPTCELSQLGRGGGCRHDLVRMI